MRILLVDDDEAFRKSQVEIMRSWGYDVIALRNEAAATTWLGNHATEVDIAVFDMKMEQDDSGTRLTRLLGHLNPFAVVVVLSAYMPADCMEAGAFSYINKGTLKTAFVRATLMRAARERMCRIYTRLEYPLLEWWASRGEAIFLRSFGQPEALSEQASQFMPLLRQIVQARMRTSLPDGTTPARAMRQLLATGDMASMLMVSHPTDPDAVRLRTRSLAFPDLIPVIRYFIAHGFAADRKMIVGYSVQGGDWLRLELQAPGLMLSAGPLADLNRYLTQPDPASDVQVDLAVFALRLTGLGAVVWAEVRGEDTVIVCKMLKA